MVFGLLFGCHEPRKGKQDEHVHESNLRSLNEGLYLVFFVVGSGRSRGCDTRDEGKVVGGCFREGRIPQK